MNKKLPEVSDAVGLPFHVSWYGVLIAQTWVQVMFHIEAITKYDIKTFIEIGMYKGGLLTALYPAIQLLGLNYVGVEIAEDGIDQRVKDLGARIIIGDCMSEEVQVKVRGSIADSRGTTMIFIDGGHKPSELKAYSKFIKRGDYICVHDFMTDDDGEVKKSDIAFLDDSPKWERVDREYRRFYGLPTWRKK